MSHHPPIEPFTPSPSAQVPHPILQAALDNLDVQLEEELVRYRRQRRYQAEQVGPGQGYRVNQRGLGQPLAKSPRKPLESFKDSAQSQPRPGRATPDLALGAAAAAAARPAPRANPGGQLRQPIPAPSAMASEGALAIAPEQSSEPTAGIASYAQQESLSAFEPDAAIQKFVRQPDSDNPEDYLESTEELLKSISGEEPELRAERETNLLNTLLTPLGVGSMLLLLLSSATLGYVIMNPPSLGWLLAHRSAESGSDAASSGQAKIDLPTTPIDSAPPSPNLAAEEFHELNLDTLSTLPTGRSTPSPTAGAKPAAAPAAVKPGSTSSAPAASTAPSSAETEAAAQPQAEPAAAEPIDPPAPEVVQPTELPPVAVEAEPPAPAPAAAPEPAAPAVATAPATPASPQSYYYVVTDYSGDPSLSRAREAVPDAYVQNIPSEGAKIKLGAFSTEARAQEQLQELQQRGISAQIYQP